MASSRLDPEGQAVFKPLWQNQDELARLAVLCFWRPFKWKHSDFRVAYSPNLFCFQDFESNPKLKNMTIEFLEDIICCPTLLPSEHRASSQLLRMLTKDEPTQNIKINLDVLLTPIQVRICPYFQTIMILIFAWGMDKSNASIHSWARFFLRGGILWFQLF